uniref:Uncharacterized protein n=1 Tax=Chromera velia CCMP2878 TaxID=1169474 RepID=A0A0G4HNI5_9ALVE|eukprot:Cvel_29484.t1-p1 / transcript=Cvel_29484.t1 / gene=Cvel_29484 / organism=Chromera_velia_CCMP2878 / gene_product=hypothetical protein / transcript_product=hypothetical protein / location=Cvel_scaffold4046:4794-7416(-) / protein_length=477 / sequence_SO=supercontig / SO=protein_coding / is_pseudo=false
MWEEFIVMFRAHIIALMKGNDVTACSLKRPNETYLYHRSESIRTCEETLTDTESEIDWPMYLSLDRLRSDDHLGTAGQSLGEELDIRMLGDSELKRLSMIFQYMLLASDMNNWTDEQIRATGGGLAGRGGFDAEGCVSTMARYNLNSAWNGTAWFEAVVAKSIRYNAETLLTFLLRDGSKFQPLAGLRNLRVKFAEAYAQVAESKLHGLLEHFEATVANALRYLPVDTVCKDIMLMTSLPLQDLTLTEGPMSPTVLPDEDGDERPTERGVYPVSRRLDQATEQHLRFAQKKAAMTAVQSYFLPKGKTFNCADIVEADLTCIRPQTWHNPDYHYLRNNAHALYISVTQKLCFIFDSCVQARYREWVINDEESDLTYKVKELLGTVSDPDLYDSERSRNPDTVKQEINQIGREIERWEAMRMAVLQARTSTSTGTGAVEEPPATPAAQGQNAQAPPQVPRVPAAAAAAAAPAAPRQPPA